MKRNAIQELVAWKSSEDRKPMVLKGARQVGKTWLMKEFGQSYYDNFIRTVSLFPRFHRMSHWCIEVIISSYYKQTNF